MAHLIRTPLAVNHWTRVTLESYNIDIRHLDALTFFGEDLPQPKVDEEILTCTEAMDMLHARNCALINLLDLTMQPPTNPPVNDFAVALFSQLKYITRTRVANARTELSLLICEERKQVTTDACIMSIPLHDILLLVQEGRRLPGGAAAAEAQLIVKAIAVFDYNNLRRTMEGQPILHSKLIPGIVMTGTAPTFYKILTTSELSQSVRHGKYPATRTIVWAHMPEVPRPECLLSEGMKPLDNRRHILRCYEAFKKFIE